MQNKIQYQKRLGQFVMAGLMTSLGTYASANDFSLVNNSFKISGYASSSDEVNAELSNDGILTPLAVLPANLNQTISNLPTFTFELAPTLGAAGTRTFKVGVSISENVANGKRFEAFIGNLILNIDINGNVTGTIPVQAMNVAVRKGVTTLITTIDNLTENGPVTFSGGVLSFNGEEAVKRLEDAKPDSAFASVLDGFSLNGTFTFRVVVQETTLGDPAKVGVTSNNTFTAIPRISTICEANPSSQVNNVFILDTPAKTGFTNAYAIQGQFRAGTGGPENTLQAFTDTDSCALSSQPTTPTTPTPTPTTTPPTAVATASVTATTSAATNFANVANQGFTIATLTALANTTSAVTDLRNLVEAGNTLSAAQQQTVRDATGSVLGASLTLLNNPAATVANIEQLSTDVNKLIEDAGQAGVGADVTLVNLAVDVGQAAALAVVRRESGADSYSTAAVTANPALLDGVLGAAVSIPPAVVRNTASVQNALPASVGAEVASRLAANLAVLKNMDNFTIGGQSVTSLLANFLSSPPASSSLMVVNGRSATVMGLTVGDVSITTDPVSGTVSLSLPGESYAGAVTAVRSVGAALPNGIFIRDNGTGLIVVNGIAIELAPVALDTVGFALAVENAGFQYGLRSTQAALRINLGNNERFAGVFAYDNLTGRNLEPASCAAISIVEPTIEPNLPNYAFGVNCASGAQQRVVPYIDFDNFFASLDAKKVNYSVDRNTGFVTITGTGVLKPSFFVRPATAAELSYHAANKDSSGVALQAMDINGDGKMDYKIIAPNGVQLLYGTN